MAVIATALMLAPSDALPSSQVMSYDKVLHFLAFFAIVLPAITVRPRAWVWVLPLAIALGGAIEIIQPYFGRSRELGDFIADALGAGAAVIVGHMVSRWWSERWYPRKFKRA